MITLSVDAFMCVIVVLLVFLNAFLVWQNRYYIKSADKRLSKANEMVLTLTITGKDLAESIKALKDMMLHLEQVYTSRTDSVIKSRDQWELSYNKLLQRYTAIEDKYFKSQEKNQDTVSEIARQPTYTTLNNMPSTQQ